MDKKQEMAQFGFEQADCETSTMEVIAAAAKEFERVLNSAKGLINVEMTVHECREIGLEDRNHYHFRVTKVDRVYP